jgi:hypothetical protein
MLLHSAGFSITGPVHIYNMVYFIHQYMQLLSSEYLRFVVIYLSAMIRLRNFIYFVGKLESEQSLQDRLRQGRQNMLPDYWQTYHLRWLSDHLSLTI